MGKITENANYIVAMFSDLLSRLHYWREKESYRSHSMGEDYDICDL